MTPDLPAPPAQLAWLSEHLAPAPLLALIEAFGGTRIYVPKTINQGSALTLAIGREPAEAMSRAFGGNELKIPIERHWQIVCQRDKGLSYSAIARKLRITEDAVWKHLNAAKLTNLQPDLFG